MLQLLNIQDPRDNLEKARLAELLKFATENGVEIPPQFQDKAMVIRKILRGRGLTRIQIPNRVLGQSGTTRIGDADEPAPPAVTAQSGVEADAVDDLIRQAMSAPKPEPSGDIKELRKECKRRGIKMARTDKAADLRAKLDGKDAA